MARRRGKAPGGGFPEEKNKMRPYYTCTVQPTAEPISVLDLTAHCRTDNDAELLLLQGYISAAREYIEGQTGRALMLSTWTRTSSRFVDRDEDCHGRVSYIERTPLAAVSKVEYYNESDVLTELPTTVYGVVTAATPGFFYLKANQTWPTLYDRPDAVVVTFTAGASSVSAVPHAIRHATKLLAAHYWKRQPEDESEKSTGIPPGIQAQITPNRVGGWCA